MFCSLKTKFYFCINIERKGIINKLKIKIMTILEAKKLGIKTVILNGFKENIDYVISLSNVNWVGEVKSYDGYSTIQCFESL